MADEPGAWSRPDMGVDPEDYVSGGEEEGSRRSSGDDANGEGEPGGSPGEDELSPGRSVIDDSDDDAVEPNEPG